MKITNKQCLPEPFVRAIIQSQARYSAGLGGSDITLTQLIKPPRMVALEKKHWGEVEEDAMGRFWALFGSAVHYLLELGATEEIHERRWMTEINGWKVSGMGDLIEGRVLRDYKVVRSVAIKDGVKEEWEKQLNGLAYLASLDGVHVDDLEIIAILRDWNQAQADHDPSYPKTPVVNLPVKMWGDGFALKWLSARVQRHQNALINLPECSDEDRWLRGEVWAIKKEGRKSAVKLHHSLESAESHLGTLDKKHSIEHRPGSYLRCERYCAAASFCSQWKTSQPN